MVRAAAKNHANVAIVTSPARYGDVLAALDADGGLDERLRRELALEAFAHTAAYDARIAAELPGRFVAAGLLDAAGRSVSADTDAGAREGRDAPLRREPAPAGGALSTPGCDPRRRSLRRRARRRSRARRSRTTTCSTPRRQPPSVGRCAARASSSSSTPTRAARPSAPTLLDAWSAALEADPVSAFGGVVALTREVDRAVAEALASIFLEIVVAPGFTDDGAERPRDEAEPAACSSTRPWRRTTPSPATAATPTGSLRTAGGAVLVTAPDIVADDPAELVVRDAPAADAARGGRPRPGLAPGPRRDLERHRARPRRTSGRDGQRPDEPRRRRSPGRGQGARAPRRGRPRRARSVPVTRSTRSPTPSRSASRPASRAFVQPGGSIRDAEAIAAVDAAGGTMLITGVRHFRH